MKRTPLVLDEQLIEAGLKATGFKTQTELVDYALRELLRRENQKQTLELKGRVHWEGNLDEIRQDRSRKTTGIGTRKDPSWQP